jgi:hypothetical protein
MSDAPRRLPVDIFGCGSREMSERVAGIYALDEARSILADVERMPAPEDGGSAVYLPHAIYCDIARARDAACFVDERTILAESLRSFVEGN